MEGENSIVASFTEITSCGSQAAAVNRYFTTGAADRVRDPIAARAETLYDDRYAASSSTARAAPSVWSTVPSPMSTASAVPVPEPSLPDVKGTGCESDVDKGREEEGGGNGIEGEKEHNDSDEEREQNDVDEEKEENDMEAQEEDGHDGMDAEEEDSYYGTEAEGSEKADEDNGSEEDQEDYYMETGSEYSYDGMEVTDDDEQPPPPAKKTLAELFQPPYELMYIGSFHNAKISAARQDRWLMVTVQSRGEFASHMHNRDLWANEVVAQVIKGSFVFSLLEKRNFDGDEGSKVCCFYKLEDDQLPAVIVLDPITGQMLAKWCGAMQPDYFLINIEVYMKSKPSMLSKPIIVQRTAAPESSESEGARGQQESAMPKSAGPVGACDAQEPGPVPEIAKVEAPAVMVDYGQPTEGEKICKLRVRFPDGNVVTKEFGSKRRVAVLFAYCRSVVHDRAEKEQAFRIMRFAGRAFEELLEDHVSSFEDLGLNCTAVSVVLDT